MFLLYPGGGLSGLLVLIATALVSWFFLRRFLIRTWTIDASNQLPDHRQDALEILKQRYARGELSREEYLKMKEDISE